MVDLINTAGAATAGPSATVPIPSVVPAGEENAPTGSTANAQQAEGKPGETAPASGGTDGGIKATEETPPSYDKLIVPDGFVLDTSAMTELTPVLSEMKASPETAQKLIDLYVKQVEQIRTDTAKQIQETTSSWSDALTKDPEIGGAKLNENLAAARKVLNKYGNAEFVEFLRDSGIGSYTPLVKFLLSVSKDALPDNMLASGQPAGGSAGDWAADAATKMFSESLK